MYGEDRVGQVVTWILQIDFEGCARQYLESPPKDGDGCFRWGGDRDKAVTFVTKAAAEMVLIKYHASRGAKAVEK